MHLVSTDGVPGAAQQSLFMPMLTRMPKARVRMLAVSLSPNAIPGAVLRQNGVPVYDVALSKQRFSIGAFRQLVRTARAFRPDIIQAWGHTAQVVSTWLQNRCEDDVKLVWTMVNTQPLSRHAGMIDRQKLKYAAKLSKRVEQLVYTSEAGASAHRRVGFPDGGHAVVPLGVDPTRFKPDFAARRKVREQLGIAHDAFVIGMMAPFQPESDHITLLKAVGEMIKTNPSMCVLLAGHGVQKGNAPLMALVGGGTLGTRTQLLGEWSDVASFFNACDLACSSALNDSGRMSLVIAMLCGIPCVATGMGAQGEVVGQFGVAVEPSSPVALIRGITRVMQMPPEKRAFMAQGARKHALTNFVSIRSLQKYLQIYYDAVERPLSAASAVPVPEIDATIPTPTAEDKAAVAAAPKPKTNRSVDMYELRDPDSLESRDAPAAREKPKASDGDVLQLFETSLAKQGSTGSSPMTERARGVTEDLEDLLSPEMLQSDKEKAAKAEAAKPVVASAPAQPAPARSVGAEPAKPVAVAAPKPVAAAVPPSDEKSLADTIKPPPPASTPEPKRAPAPVVAAVTAPADELALADTMTLFSVPEIKPPQPASTPEPKRAPAPVVAAVTAPADELAFADTTPRVQPEIQKSDSTSVAEAPRIETPQPAATIETTAAASPEAIVASLPSDSSTVPSLAVDALLSVSVDEAAKAEGLSTELARSQTDDQSAQLDFLSDTTTDVKQAAS